MDHWTTVKNIIMYLHKTKDTILAFGGKDELKVSGYSDASFQIDQDNSYSQFSWSFSTEWQRGDLEEFQASEGG